MKSFTKHITIRTEKRIDFINITNKIQQTVQESKIQEGIVLINPTHIASERLRFAIPLYIKNYLKQIGSASKYSSTTPNPA